MWAVRILVGSSIRGVRREDQVGGGNVVELVLVLVGTEELLGVLGVVDLSSHSDRGLGEAVMALPASEGLISCQSFLPLSKLISQVLTGTC